MRAHVIVTLMLICSAVTNVTAADFEDGMVAFQQGRFDVAFEKWGPLAKGGHIEAQVGLGLMYTTGKGVVENDTEAAKWFRLAAEQGNALAQIRSRQRSGTKRLRNKEGQLLNSI